MDKLLINKLIHKEYNKLKSSEYFYQKLNIINGIIIIRKEMNYYKVPELYSDVRNFINYYFESIHEIKADSYEFDEAKLMNVINYLPMSERVSLLEYANRITKIGEFEEYNKWIYKELNKAKLQFYIANFKLKYFLPAASCLTSYNIASIIVSLIIVFMLLTVLLLPSFSDTMIIFEIKYDEYYEDFYLNHFANMLTYVFQISNDFKIIPNGITGIATLILIKVISLGLLFNYLFKEISRRISL